VSWIDDDKAASDDGDDRRRIEIELRLHKAKLVAAKAPRLLNLTVEQLKSDCAELPVKFRGKLEKQCAFSSDGYTHKLSGCKVPWKVLNMNFNIPGHCVEISESRVESRGREVRAGTDQIRIAVNEEDELELHFRGSRYLTPEALSEGLIRYVRGN
jgi:hypothetical protein